VILVFLRHFGWLLCRQHAAQLRGRYQEITGLGAEVVAVGTGDIDYARRFAEEESAPFPVLVDDSGAAARAASIRKVNFATLLFDPRSFRGARQAHREGFRVKKSGKRVNQLGATFVIGPGPRLLYSHVDAHTADHAPVGEVLQALEGAGSGSASGGWRPGGGYLAGVVIDKLLENAKEYASRFSHGGLGGRPAKRVAIVACMDARIDPHAIFGLREGDAHVVRNAGGAVTDDTIRSLAISQRLLGTEEILLLHHTECGMMSFRAQDFARQIETESGIRPPWAMETFTDVDQDVRQSMARILASPFIPNKQAVRGFVYDVSSGRVYEVKP
jgi:carbonic anhydrase